MSNKIEMPPNVQAFINKRGSMGSDAENAAFWKEFRKAANAYADVQASRICTAEHKIATLEKQLAEMTDQRDAAIMTMHLMEGNHARELTEAVEQRDRLVEALEKSPVDLHAEDEQGICLCSQCEFRRMVRYTLTTVKGASHE